MQFEQLGPYRIERQIGRGGMGTVFAAVNVDTGEPAAIKVLSTALAADEDFRERFKAEIESLRQLRHENIVQLFGWHLVPTLWTLIPLQVYQRDQQLAN